MASLSQLIRKNHHRPIRRCYIKRRDLSGNYESSWTQVDIWKNRDRVINWGKISIEINHQPNKISTFNVSNLTMVFDNSEGHFNSETFPNSIWYGYLNRKFTKLKIDCGYLDEDGTEVGVANIFEGIIDRVFIGEDQRARVVVLSYQTILNKYDILDLSLAATERYVEDLHGDIMNQSKITKFIPYVAATPGISNVTIADPSALTGSYWDVLLYLAQVSNSIPLLVGSAWSFTSREASVSSQWDFKGFGADDQPDIFKIYTYDDEGADKVRLRFQEKDGTTVAISSDTTLRLKYLADADGSEVEYVDLTDVKSTDKQSVLNSLVDYWEHPRPTIEFGTRMLINILKPTDKITIEIIQKTSPSTGVYVIGVSKLGTIANGGDSHVLVKKIGAINISSGEEWMVVKIVKDIHTWSSRIKAEKIPT